MQVAQLVLEYLKVLAWPLVVGTTAVIFRRTLRGMLGRLA